MSRIDHVRAALELLARFEPFAHQHLVRETREIVWAPTWCGKDAVACAGGHLGRRIVLRHDPLSMDVVRLASTLFHEALHLWSDRHGHLVTVHHKCQDCRTFEARARDWIYREQAALEARLRAATGVPRRSGPSLGEVVGAIVVGGAAGAVIGALIAGLTGPRT